MYTSFDASNAIDASDADEGLGRRQEESFQASVHRTRPSPHNSILMPNLFRISLPLIFVHLHYSVIVRESASVLDPSDPFVWGSLDVTNIGLDPFGLGLLWYTWLQNLSSLTLLKGCPKWSKGIIIILNCIIANISRRTVYNCDTIPLLILLCKTSCRTSNLPLSGQKKHFLLKETSN